MSLGEVRTFVEYATAALSQSWNSNALQPVSGLHPSGAVLGARETLLRADVHTLWFRWFLDSILDPEKFVLSYPGYAYLVAEVFPKVNTMFPSVPLDERQELASAVTRAIGKEIERRRNLRRQPISQDTRLSVWDNSGPDQRCWVCGYQFDNLARNEFLGLPLENATRQLAMFVDLAKPRGLNARDYKIELDHVDPVSAGGQSGDNLRLSCGWCNAHKSNSVSLYDVAGECRFLKHPKEGKIAVPQPFWVIRLLGLRQRCEWAGGCINTTKNSELTVALRNPKGATNPINMTVVCNLHDTMKAERLISRKLFDS
jgi:HNH endonuclease